MRSRLGFSVAVYLMPDILLLDEVLVVEYSYQKKAEAEMVKKNHSNQTVVLVSHSKEQINRLCSRVIKI